MSAVKIGTHNVKVSLADKAAAQALAIALATGLVILGLQEWGRGRRRRLAEHATQVRFTALRRRLKDHPVTGFAFAYPRFGGQPVVVDATWGRILSARAVKLSRRRRGVRATYGTEVLILELATGRLWAVLNVHPVAHHDRPANKAAHTEAIQRMEDWVESWHGHARVVLGDMNKRLMRLGQLHSCWEDRPGAGTGPGGSTIDHVYADKAATQAVAIRTPSDHKLVVATYPS